MTMWRPTEPVEEDVSDLPGIDPQSKRRRSRRHRWRDGLADQTVVNNLEGVRSYQAFERVLIGSADPRSVIELELVHRLASLLWRLRRACAIETGLLELQGDLVPARREDPSRARRQPGAPTTQANGHSKGPGPNGRDAPTAGDQERLSTSLHPPRARWSNSRRIAQYFLRLSHLDPTLLDRVGAYEARLWRQAAQTIWTLEAMRQPPPPMRQRLRHPAAALFARDRER